MKEIMALTKCKECGTEISTTAKACPKCGAAPEAKTSVATWIIGALMVAGFASYISGNQSSKAALAARTPAQVEADQAEQQAYLAVLSMGKVIKKRMRDPSSLVWESIRANTDASVICMQYRAKNGFGGFSREITVLADGRASSENKDWQRHCTTGLSDFTHARKAI